ncbi:MAG: energy transducer TonB [Flammeovirgaceae bacterium]
MKKSIFIVCTVLVVLSVTAFSYLNWESKENVSSHSAASAGTAVDVAKEQSLNSELIYDVGPRFVNSVNMTTLNTATSITDILPKEATESVASYQKVEVSILYPDGEVKMTEFGIGAVLTSAQLELLQSATISMNVHIKANIKKKDLMTWVVEDDYLSYYMTIIPEEPARYMGGQDALIEYLKASSEAAITTIGEDNVQSGRIGFIVSPNGTIEQVRVMATSGDDQLDQVVMESIRALSGKWYPALNSEHEKIEQELIFFFGAPGC